MNKPNAQTHPLPWWAAGILLGLVLVLAVSLTQSLDVSHQFIATNTGILRSTAPEYIESHPLVRNEDYVKSEEGWWLAIGILIGACIAAIQLRLWKLRATCDLWQQNHSTPIIVRMIAGFVGGFLMLLGAGIAYGGVSSNFVKGLSELSLSAIPFTIAMLVSGMLVAYLVYPATSSKNNHGK
jgi:hypothetical protein